MNFEDSARLQSTTSPAPQLTTASPEPPAVASEPALAVEVSNPALNPAEASALARHEVTIRTGLATFNEVGAALMEIRAEKLYRMTHPTFESYCAERWNITSSRARQLIGAASTAEEIKSVTVVTPTSERQTRPLAGLPLEQKREVWKAAVEESGGKRPTAATVKAAAERIAPRKPKPAADAAPAPKKTREYNPDAPKKDWWRKTDTNLDGFTEKWMYHTRQLFGLASRRGRVDEIAAKALKQVNFLVDEEMKENAK